MNTSLFQENPIRNYPSKMINSVAFSPIDSSLAAGLFYKNIQVWDTEGGEQTLSTGGATAQSLAYNPINGSLAAGLHSNNIKIWDTQGNEQTLTTRNPVEDLAFSPINGTLAAVIGSSRIKVWRQLQGKGRTLYKSRSNANSVAFNPIDGSLAAAFGNLGGRGAAIKIWDVAGREIETINTDEQVRSVTFSRDGFLAAGLGNGNVTIWDTQRRIKQILTTDSIMANSVAFSPRDDSLVAGLGNGKIKIWNRGTEQTLLTGAGFVTDISFSPHGLLAAGLENGVKVWAPASTGRATKPARTPS
jgi:WD40 repeat protein